MLFPHVRVFEETFMAGQWFRKPLMMNSVVIMDMVAGETGSPTDTKSTDLTISIPQIVESCRTCLNGDQFNWSDDCEVSTSTEV